jgi:hypothetical protein
MKLETRAWNWSYRTVLEALDKMWNHEHRDVSIGEPMSNAFAIMDDAYREKILLEVAPV